MKRRNFISSHDFDLAEIKTIFELAKKIKKNPAAYHDHLKGKVAGLIFEKPSTRTRVSFASGFISLGAHVIYMGSNDIQFGVREEVRDFARTLERYLDAVVLRTFSHEMILEFAKYFNKPVVNGLSDLEHPCQAYADFLTIEEKFGSIKGKKIAYIGDPNNVCNSLLLIAARLGAHFCIAAPSKYKVNAKIFSMAKKEASKTGAKLEFVTSPEAGARGADVIYTDVWVSMGQENDGAKKKKELADFQVNSKLLTKTKRDVKVMHCLPAHRGEEITNDVLEGKSSIVFDQAENRLHVQKAILVFLFGTNVYRPFISSKRNSL